jgi:hypothetical protein
MADYMQSTDEGDPYFDFSKMTRDQAAALQEVTVEDYLDGRGDDARAVKRVKFRLADKRAALVDIARHLPEAHRSSIIRFIARKPKPPDEASPKIFEISRSNRLGELVGRVAERGSVWLCTRGRARGGGRV